jgi:hypothetical protein
MDWIRRRLDIKGFNKDLDYILAIVGLPVCVTLLGQHLKTGNFIQIILWLIFTLLLSVAWPIEVSRALIEVGFDRLWIFLLILPLLVLVLALVEQWSLVGVAAMIIASLGPFSLLLISPKKMSTEIRTDGADGPPV